MIRRGEFKDKVMELEHVLNNFSLSNSTSTDAMADDMYIYMHRTNQQTFTRLCVSWLKKMAGDDVYTDDRNKASQEVAKILMEGHDDLRGLPFI